MTKRSAPASKKAASTGGDFKRLKAKVGKRAPKKLNATDTSFRTASIRTTAAAQASALSKESKNDIGSNVVKDMIVSCASELVSLKVGGKSLQELTSQLGSHPAPSARKSATTGIRDIIASLSQMKTQKGGIVSHIVKGILEVTISTLARSACVDEDSDVRETSRAALNELFVAIATFEDKSIDSQTDVIIYPHIPLLSAYLLSALNSMDSDIRKDAVRVTDLYFGTFPTGFQTQAEGMIPAFLKILKSTSRSINYSIDAKQKKKKGSSASNQGGFRIAVLKALVKILQASNHVVTVRNFDSLSANSRDDSKLDTVYNPDTRADFALLLLRRPTTYILGKDKRLSSNGFVPNTITVETLFHQNRNQDLNNQKESLISAVSFSSLSLNEGLSNVTRLELLGKIRDCWVELMQSGTKHGSSLSIRLGNVDEATVLLMSLLNFWQCYCETLLIDERIDGNKTLEQLKTTIEGTLSLLLDCFPIRDDSGNPVNEHFFNSLNGLLSLVIAKIGSFVKDTAIWIEQIFVYISEQMAMLNEDFHNFEKHSSFALVELVEQLIQMKSHSRTMEGYILSRSNRLKLLSSLGNTFIPDPNENDSFKLIIINSPSRKAITLVAKLMLEQGEELSDADEFSTQLLYIAYRFPTALLCYKNDYLEETDILLQTLVFIMQRWDGSNNNEDDAEKDGKVVKFSKFLRDKMCLFFEQNITKTHESSFKRSSLFECLPQRNQRQLICLLGLIRNPTTVTLKQISDILLRNQAMKPPDKAKVSDEIRLFMNETICSIRKEISLPDYLNFLVSSTGLNKLKKLLHEGTTNIFLFDPIIKQFCTSIVNIGGYKFILSLEPILLKWLVIEEDDEFRCLSSSIIKTRAVVSLLSACAHDLSSCKGDIMQIFTSSPGLDRRCADSILANLCLNTETFMWEKVKIREYFSSVVSLLDNAPFFWLSLLDSIKHKCSNLWTEKDLDPEKVTKQGKLLQCVSFGFLHWIENINTDTIAELDDVCLKLLQFSSNLENACASLSAFDSSLAIVGKSVKLKTTLRVGNKLKAYST